MQAVPLERKPDRANTSVRMEMKSGARLIAYIDHFRVNRLQFLVAYTFSRPEECRESVEEYVAADELPSSSIWTGERHDLHPKMFSPLVGVHACMSLVGHYDIDSTTNNGKTFLQYSQLFFPW